MSSYSRTSSYYTLFYASLALAGVLAVLAAIPTLGVSRWSLAYWRAMANGQAVTAAPPQALHRRAAAWLADEALQQGDLAQAQALQAQLSTTTDPFARRVLGLLYAREGDLDAALQAWTEAGDYHSLSQAAAVLEEEGRSDLAFDALRAAQQVAPEQGVSALASFLARHDAPAEAAYTLQQAINDYPFSIRRAGWMRTAGRLLQQAGQWGEAEAVYRQLAAEKPVQGDVQLGLLAYARGDGLDAALAFFDQAMDADPASGEGAYQKAALLGREKRYEEADRWYEAALAREPDKKHYWLAYANNARTAGDYTAAIRRYRAAALRFPDYAAPYSELAWAYRLADDPQAAIQAMERALALLEKPNVGYELRAGSIYEWAGEPEKALAHYRAALEIQPENASAVKGIARLEGEK